MNRNLFFVSLAVCLFLISAPTFAASLIALNHTTNALYEVNTDDLGNPQFIGVIEGSWGDLSALVWVSADQAYTTDRATNTLITVDPSDASVIASVGLDRDLPIAPRGFDLSPDGILYGIFGGMQLATINPLTGVTSLVASITGAAGIEALAFAPDGTLYAVGANRLYTLNLSNGGLTNVGSLGGEDVDALTFADGFLYGADSLFGTLADLYHINPLDGTLLNLGSSGVGELNGIAAKKFFPKVSIEIVGGSPQECSEVNGALVNLNAIVVTLPEDPVDTVEWYLDDYLVGSGEAVAIHVPLGLHTIRVDVTTLGNSVFTDQESIEVVDTTPPSIAISFTNRKGKEVTTVKRSGMNRIRVKYPVTDDCDQKPLAHGVGGVDISNGQLVLIQATKKQIRLQAQKLTLSVKATDASGNMAEEEAVLVVTD